MDIRIEIARAFANHPRPFAVVRQIYRDTPDERDAQWFQGRDTSTIRWEDWNEHPSAPFFFDREAFLYYLPSLMLVSADNSKRFLMAVDAIINMLAWSNDRFSPESYFYGLSPQEYDAVSKWLHILKESNAYGGQIDGGDIDVALRTLGTLRGMK